MAAGMLASGLVAEGKFAVAIPSFGFERRGAPVVAFLRTDPHEIRRMTNITHPDCVVCIDPTVSRSVNIFSGMKTGGSLILTTAKRLSDLAIPDIVETVGLIDAVRLAIEIFRRPITNTLMLGAFSRTTGIVSLDSLKQTLLESEFRDAGLDQNLAALDRGYNETQVHRRGSRAAA